MKSNSQLLDQFYTKQEISKTCFDKLCNYLTKNNISFDQWLEPSAGNGAFFNLLPDNKLGIDIEPKIKKVIAHDFLTFNLDSDNIYVTIGNPPFGKNSSLAIKFFNKCSLVSSVIGFIVPKTFKKDSVQSKLNPYFHLQYEFDIPKNSFVLDGQEVDVPCVFQIWKKESHTRVAHIKNSTSDFDIIKDKSNSDFALQRVGVHAGTIKDKTIFNDIAEQSHFLIKANIPNVREILTCINWNTIKFNTAGNPSISKNELINAYKYYKTLYVGHYKNYYLINDGNGYKLIIRTLNNLLELKFTKEQLILDPVHYMIAINQFKIHAAQNDFDNLVELLSL